MHMGQTLMSFTGEMEVFSVRALFLKITWSWTCAKLGK